MNEVWRSLRHGGNWTDRERLVGLWLKRILVAGAVIGILFWNQHMQRLGAESHVWNQWVNEQCRTGDASRCMSYVDVSLKSGLPSQKFWTEHPEMRLEVNCIIRQGWYRAYPMRTDFSSLAAVCHK